MKKTAHENFLCRLIKILYSTANEFSDFDIIQSRMNDRIYIYLKT